MNHGNGDRNKKRTSTEKKQMLTERPCLAHYGKDKDTMVTIYASKTGLGISLWQKQDDANIKLIA